MPQRKKPEIHQRFLAAAVELFDERGFHGASLREVAARAEGSLGNLRAYFPTKDALFEAACGDVAGRIDRALAEARDLPRHRDGAARRRMDHALVRAVVRFTVEHRVALRLLLDRSAGSSRASWRDDLLNAYVALEQSILEAYVRDHPDAFGRVPSPRFVQALCRVYFGLAEDFVRGSLTEAELRTTIDELDAFRHAGMSVFLKEET